MSKNRGRRGRRQAHRGQRQRENDPEDPDMKSGKQGSVERLCSPMVVAKVGGRAFVVDTDGREKEVECGIGEVATAWDGEVAGIAEGLASLPRRC